MDASNGGVNMNEMNGEPDAGHYHPHTSTRAVHSLNATVVSLHLSSRCMFVAFQKQLDNRLEGAPCVGNRQDWWLLILSSFLLS